MFQSFIIQKSKQFSFLFSRGLADVNGDGQMDINEFSLACKMITMKLKGFEVPKTLPPALSMSMAAAQPQQAMPPNSLNIMGQMPQMQQQQMMQQPRMPGLKPFIISKYFLEILERLRIKKMKKRIL